MLEVLWIFLIFLFVPRRGHTEQGKECLIYRSVRDPNVGYEFHRKSRGGNVRRTANGDIAYVCGGCALAQQLLRNQRAQNIPSVRQIGFGDNGRFRSDPDQHHHFCNPIPWVELERRQLYRNIKENVRGKDFSSSQAVGMLNQAIAEKGMNPAERQQFNRSMPSMRSLKRMLRKATAPADYPADFGIEDIPPELQNSPFEGRGLMAHFGAGGENPFLLMMDENLRDIFRLATDIIFDGTFDSAPKKDQKVSKIMQEMNVLFNFIVMEIFENG